MSGTPTLELRFTGPGMKPGLIRSKEIADLIVAFERMIAAYVLDQNPTLNTDDIIIGLADVKDQSLGLCFQPNLEALTMPAVYAIAEAIRENQFDRVPYGTRKGLQDISKFINRHDCDAEFYALNGERALLMTMTTAVEIPLDLVVTGETVLYGQITRTGGIEPRIQFHTIDGQTVYCKGSRELVQEAGKLLYQDVALRGEAAWNGDTWQIDSFTAESIEAYRETSPTKALFALREAVAGAFDDIEDVDAFVQQIRVGA